MSDAWKFNFLLIPFCSLNTYSIRETKLPTTNYIRHFSEPASMVVLKKQKYTNNNNVNIISLDKILPDILQMEKSLEKKKRVNSLCSQTCLKLMWNFMVSLLWSNLSNIK
jgi:hypothetical protein